MRALSILFSAALLLLSCRRSDPLSESLVLPDPSRPTPPDLLHWRGDLAGLASSSVVYPRLSVRGRVAFLCLGNAVVFTSSGVGIASATPPSARAFRLLLAEPLRELAFLELARSPSLVAQLYGLAGLRLVAPERFAALAPFYRSRNDSVRTFSACIADSQPFSEIVGPASSNASAWDISNGAWPRDLAGLQQGPNPGVQRTRFARR